MLANNNIILLVLMLLGIVNGIAISLYILMNKKRKGFVKYIAIASLLFSISYIKDFLIYYQYGDVQNVFIPRFLLEYTQTTLFVPLFVHIAYSRLIEKKVSYFWWLVFMGTIPYWLLIIIKVGIVPMIGFINSYATSIIDLIALALFIIIYFKHKKSFKKYPKESKLVITFLIAYAISTAIRWLMILIVFFYKSDWTFKLWNFFISMNIILMSSIIYMLSVNLLIYYSKKRKKKMINKKLPKDSDRKLDSILTRIVESQIFIQKGITIEKVAAIHDIDSKSLSSYIRLSKEVSYNEYMNSLRLTYFLNSISDENLNTLTIYGLAENAGFNSKSTFNRVFKKKFNCTPSEYAQKEDFKTLKQVPK